jgi:hypothetical protein
VRARTLPRIAAAAALLALLLVAGAGTALAAPADRDGAKHGGGGGGGGTPKPLHGYDISYPQCGAAYPSNPLFGIVGVNGGRVFSGNPCLDSQLVWAGGAAAELYVNTGNPGPALSSFWPRGQTAPRFCDPNNADTADCAYDYGWNAAADSYVRVEQAYAARAIAASPSLTTWWFDVETLNSWRTDTTLNVAALQGGFDYLRSRLVTKLGFYSTTLQWNSITGGSRTFAAYPSWGAGSPSESAAKSLCATTVTSFTGGRLALVQYPANGFDADVRC